jgi:putative aldouronate transport system substrate-binding protein
MKIRQKLHSTFGACSAGINVQMKRLVFQIGCCLLLPVLVFGVTGVCGAAKKPPVELKVEVFDRATPGYQPDNNYWTRWIQKQFGTPNNIKMKFIPVIRLQEIDKLNILMASNDAPDIVFTYDLFTVYNYVRYGGLTELTAPLNKYGKRLKKYLGKDVLKAGVFNGRQYAIPSKRALYGALNGFIRKDWLDKLGLPLPKTTQEWYRTMKAFKEKDPGKMGSRTIPFGLLTDVQNIIWSSRLLLDSFKKKMTVNESKYLPDWLMPGFKDGMRFMNKLYNEGLISPEFALDKDSATYKKDIQQGRIGYFINNFDFPYRITPGLVTELKKNVPGAQLVPCDPFVNSRGKHYKMVYDKYGFYILIPKSSKRVAEAIKYLNWMAKPAVRDFLVNGKKGIHYKKLRQGVPVNILVDGPKRLTTDIALIVNGKDFGNTKKNIRAGAFGCPGFEKEWIQSYKMSVSGDTYQIPKYPIESEAKLKRSLYEKEAEIFVKSLVVKPAEFDRTYDRLVREYLKMGGQRVINDRKAYLKIKK